MSRSFGPLTAVTPTGEPLQSATVAFKEADGATTLAQALYAASSGGASTSTHTTNSKGQLNRYAQYAQRAFYTLNGDSTIWPIDFEVDPADVMAMGPDGVTVTQGYRAVARMRLAPVEAKIRDMGGFVANVDAYADGVTVNNYTVSGTGGNCSAAVIAALVDLATWGGGILEFGIGSYCYPAGVTWINNVLVRGTRGHSVLIHPPNSSTLVNALGPSSAGYTNLGFTGLEFNGNWENNLDFPAASSEVAITGDDCFFYNNTLRNFNAFGVQWAGTRTVIANNRVLGPNNGAGAASYENLHVGHFPNRYAGRDGIFTPGNLTVKFGLVHGNYVTGLRLPGIVVGGSGLIVTQNHVENCHRSYGFAADGTTETGGGQIALCPTTVSSAYPIYPTDWVIGDNYVGPSATSFAGDVLTGVTTWANGIELNSVTDGVCSDNVIERVPVFGISLDTTQRIMISGGSIRGCGTASRPGGSGAFRVADNTSKFVAMGINFQGNVGTGVYAVHLAGTTNHYAFLGCIFEGNTLNWDNTATGRNFKLQGNVTIDGDLVPEVLSMTSATVYAMQILNDDINGDGLLIQAGSTSAEFALNILTRRGAANLLSLTGAATLRIGEVAGAARVTADLSHATLANRLLFQTTTADSPSSVGVLPLGTSRQSDFAAYAHPTPASAAVAAIVRATATEMQIRADSPSGSYQSLGVYTSNALKLALTAGGIMIYLSQAAGTSGIVKVGRTAPEAQLGVSGATDGIVAGTVAGDAVLVSDSGDLHIGASGAKSTIFKSSSLAVARFDAVKNKILHDGSGAKAITDTGGYVWVPYSLGKPTGNPGTPTGSSGAVPLAIDLTNLKLCFWDGAAWRTSAAFT